LPTPGLEPRPAVNPLQTVEKLIRNLLPKYLLNLRELAFRGGNTLKFPKSGLATYGEAIGIIMQIDSFPRIPGDVGNANTFKFPVRYKMIKDVRGPELTVKKPSQRIEKIVVEAAKELEEEGVRAITCGCGFTIYFQEVLANAVEVPVFTSSLLLVPLVSRTIGKNGKVGIVTAREENLTEKHLEMAGIDKSISLAIKGLDSLPKEVRGPKDRLLSDETDPRKRLEMIVERTLYVVRLLISENPNVKALVFECTNLPPAAPFIQEETGLPVYDVTTLIKMAYDAVVRRRFPIGHTYM